MGHQKYKLHLVKPPFFPLLSSWIPSKDRILTHGMDLDKLGIHDGGSHNLELHDPELPKCGASDLFAGPFANHPNRWVDIKIPSEFSQIMVTPATGNQRGETVSLYHALKSSYGMLGGSDLLARIDPMKYDESLLFWIYYNYPEDVLMMACGWALKQKKWSYGFGDEMMLLGLFDYNQYLIS